MNIALKITTVLLPLLYLGATAGYGFWFFAGSVRAQTWARGLFTTVLGLHLVHLVMLTLESGQFPAATISQMLGALAFAVAVVYALVEWTSREQATGFWMLTLAFILQLLSSFLTADLSPQRAILSHPLFAIHVAMGLIGYAAFVVGAGYGFLFLRLYAEIKRSRFSNFFGKLPPLEVLERMMAGALLVGFLSLTGVVISGVVWAVQVYQQPWLTDSKILFSLATWGFYGLALTLRQVRGWGGRQTAFASLVGLAAIICSIFAINLQSSHLP